MTITLYDQQKNRYEHPVSDSFFSTPDQTEVPDDCDDDRITLTTCNEDGTQRLVVTGKYGTGHRRSEAEHNENMKNPKR